MTDAVFDAGVTFIAGAICACGEKCELKCIVH